MPLAALHVVADFGANPGALAMYEHVPDGLADGRPVVVVLHGCTQTADDMVTAGWNDLADEVGFTVVYAEQETANNSLRCFNWAGEFGDLADLTRGQGENQSIASMIDTAIATHHADASRVYVSGFSAGGAFAAVMLATWPDKLAGGAILSGVPFDCAENLTDAYACQALSQHPELQHTAAEWAAKVRAADPGFAGAYPRVAIWHGSADTTVDPVAADELEKQWSGVGAVVDLEEVAGMGHAISMGANDPAGACSGSGAFYEDHDRCSTRRVAAFFGLLDGAGGGDAGGVDAGVDAGAGADGVTPSAGCAAGGGDASPLAVIALAHAAVRRRHR